jgi:creatinine amidohydrolase/Fe(II)-dependent formamide hydrolase-like protein
MIDGHDTTDDWQAHSGDICVLPVGSFEQHAAHLPLDTDNILADYLGRLVAEDLDAALLPTLRYATCLEHSGFRGSISLRPETLMQVVRDLADEVERQGFRVMVLLNAHGGNHCLVPVVRDLNRMDRAIKVLLVAPGTFADPDIQLEGRERGLDIHAGEWETSLMLAIRPDLVRPASVDAPSRSGEVHPLQQADLTTFGVGHFSPRGAVGYPTAATAEKGRAIAASIGEHLLPYVRDRIRRLRECPRYAGGGGIAVRRMSDGDVVAGVHLSTLAGWNQTEDDWRLFTTLSPEGCVVATHAGRVIGTITTLCYGERLSWIGMLLVDPAFRRMGVGTRLLRAAIETLSSATIRLDATPAGRGLYERAGFVCEHGLRRLTVQAMPYLDGGSPGTTPMGTGVSEQVARLDRAAFGGDRAAVLEALWARAPGLAWHRTRSGRVTGFCLGRRGAHYQQIGPVIAETLADAISVCRASLVRLAGSAVVLDVPDYQVEFLDWLRRLGFSETRSFVRMVLGDEGTVSRDQHERTTQHQYAVAGPELG